MVIRFIYQVTRNILMPILDILLTLTLLPLHFRFLHLITAFNPLDVLTDASRTLLTIKFLILKVVRLRLTANIIYVNFLHILIGFEIVDSNGLIYLIPLLSGLLHPTLLHLHLLQLLHVLGHPQSLLLHFQIVLAFFNKFGLVHFHDLAVNF